MREGADNDGEQVRELAAEGGRWGGGWAVVAVGSACRGDEDCGWGPHEMVGPRANAAARTAGGAMGDGAAPFGNHALGSFTLGAVAAAGTKLASGVGDGKAGDGTRDGTAAVMGAVHVIVAAAWRAVG